MRVRCKPEPGLYPRQLVELALHQPQFTPQSPACRFEVSCQEPRVGVTGIDHRWQELLDHGAAETGREELLDRQDTINVVVLELPVARKVT